MSLISKYASGGRKRNAAITLPVEKRRAMMSTSRSNTSNQTAFVARKKGLQATYISSPWNSSAVEPRNEEQSRSRTGRIAGSYSMLRCLLLAICFSIILCSQGVEARDAQSKTRKTELKLDHRKLHHPANRMYARTTTIATLPSDIPAPTQTGSQTSTGPSVLQADSSQPPEQLPRPFDGSLGSNFTSPSCPTFFHDFLHNDTFNDCLPFSLLLQTSRSFFAASRSPPLLTSTLDATCNVDYAKCSALMNQLATQIQSATACAQDFALQNPVVIEAYRGFTAYAPLYRAGCATDRQGKYCFTDAVADARSPSSSYVYYLPLGLGLPTGTGSAPSCTRCLSDTMNVFYEYASDPAQPLSVTYPPAAQQLDEICGAQFVAEAAVTTTSFASVSRLPPLGLGLVSLGAVLFGIMS